MDMCCSTIASCVQGSVHSEIFKEYVAEPIQCYCCTNLLKHKECVFLNTLFSNHVFIKSKNTMKATHISEVVTIVVGHTNFV